MFHDVHVRRAGGAAIACSGLAQLALVACVGLGLCAAASAENWQIAPLIVAGYRYSDNYRLDRPGSEVQVSGADVDASFTVRTINPRSRFEVTPRIHATHFPQEREEDSTDYLLGVLFEDATPRQRIGVSAEASREDVVRSELPGPELLGELGDPGQGDSGIVRQRTHRDLIRVGPHYSYAWTGRYRMELDASYLKANYEGLEQFYQDFSEYSVSAGLGVQFSQRSSIVLAALASRYDTATETQAYGGQARWTMDFSPTSRMYFSVGAQQTDPESGERQTSFIGGVGGRWIGERNRLFVDFARNIQAIAAGTVVERHQLRVGIDHDVSPRLAMLLAVRASRDEELNESGAFPTRQYASAQAGLEWRWLRFMSLRATYNYFWQEYSDEPSDTSSNGLLIGIAYEPRRQD